MCSNEETLWRRVVVVNTSMLLFDPLELFLQILFRSSEAAASEYQANLRKMYFIATSTMMFAFRRLKFSLIYYYQRYSYTPYNTYCYQ